MKREVVTQKELKEWFIYDKDTGELSLKKPRRRQPVGTVVGSTAGGGYLQFEFKGAKFYVHRLVWIYTHGTLGNKEIDHINHNKQDNRLENLRLVTHKENLSNKSLYSKNVSGHHGVSFVVSRGKWKASIYVGKKLKYLGYFKDAGEAVKARKFAEKDRDFHQNHGK